jgi:hypothetical protein
MIRVELDDRIPIQNRFVQVAGDRAHVDVIGK